MGIDNNDKRDLEAVEVVKIGNEMLVEVEVAKEEGEKMEKCHEAVDEEESGSMPQIPEVLTMDLEFLKKNQITISTHSAIIYLVGSIAAVIATGLLVYQLSSCPVNNQTCDNTTTPETTAITWQTDMEKSTTIKYPTEETDISETTVTMATTQQTVEEADGLSVRLPTSSKPIDYYLHIVPFFHNFTFRGTVNVTFVVSEPTLNVTLHVIELTVDGLELLDDNGTAISIQNVTYHKKFQFLIIHTVDYLFEGQYVLRMRFNGTLNNAMQGFYRSSYRIGNETRWLAVTQFQPTDARRAFPCFDEPALKATFTLTIERPMNMSSLSNMPKLMTATSKNIPKYEIDYYTKSVPMSTYLVAYIVSDFKARSVGNISVWAREDAINQTAYSLGIATGVLQYYEKFFKIPFPLPKIDMVALPDFSAGAMENWGLITYRETALLYEDGLSSKKFLSSIAAVIAHELGHQWFGNLVTPSWWTDLWLNEGFATYLENVGVDAVHPEWFIFDQFIVEAFQVVLDMDALKSSHRISIPVTDPAEINDIFDRISYEKGASIIHMMNNFLTPPVFQQGLTNYLNEKKYSSADQDDLWHYLTLEAQKNNVLTYKVSVKEIMDTWTLQTGYPVINVTRDYSTNDIFIKQERFLLDENKTSSENYLWWVPLTYKTSLKKIEHMWMENERSVNLSMDLQAKEWILFNINETSYCRVNYDTKNWMLLGSQLQEDHLMFDVKNRAQIIDDTLNLASAGYLDYDVALNMTTYMTKEYQYIVWKATLRNLNHLLHMFLRSGHFDKFKHYVFKLITPVLKYVGFQDKPSESILTTFLRSAVLGKACMIGHPDCVSYSIRQFQNWRATPNPDKLNPISPNLKSTIYCTAIQHGGEEEWNFAWKQYLAANLASEQSTILTALGCTRETWLLNKFLTMAITEGSGIRKQDVISVFRAVGYNVIGQPLAFKFLSTNWKQIKLYLGTSFMSMNSILHAVTGALNTPEDLEDLRTFARNKHEDLKAASRTINQVIEQTEANIRWMEKYFNKICKWLDGYNMQP